MAELTITRDREELERLEGIIEKNLQSFYEVGRALIKIRDEQLYSKVRGIENFETYCRKRWDFGKWYAYKIIESTQVMKQLDNCPIRPATESQARPLVKLKDNPEAQREAWQRAVETAPEGKVTAAHVQKVVKAYQLKGGGDPGSGNGLDQSGGAAVEPTEETIGLVKLKVAWRAAKKDEKREFLQWVDQRRKIDGI